MHRTYSSSLSVLWLAGCLVGCGGLDSPGISEEPRLATTRELVADIDFTTLPLAPESTLGQLRATHLTAEIPGSVKPVADRYLGLLAEKGFAPGREANAKTVTDESAQATLVGKHGVRLSMTVTPLGPDKVQLQLLNMGAYDARRLPKPEGAVEMFASPGLAMFSTGGSVGEVTTSVGRLLAASGWQEYAPLGSQRIDMPTLQQRFYRQRGNDLHVSVAEAPAQGGKTVITYQLLALSHELPAPLDSVDLAFDDAKGELTCTVPRSLADVATEMRNLLAAAGLQITAGEEPSEQRVSLRFEAANNDVILVTLTPDEPAATKARILTVPAAVVAKLRDTESVKPTEAPGAID